MKYKATYEYRGRVTIEVEAKSEKAAAENRDALAEADEAISRCLSLVQVKAREV